MQMHPESSGPPSSTADAEDDGFFSLRITLQTIELLEAVASHGSIALAANALSIPFLTLVATLQALEARLGFTLFFLGGTPTRPTPACQALLEEGRLLRQAQATAGKPSDPPPGP